MSKAIDRIHFHYLTKAFQFASRTELKQFLVKQLRKEGKKINTISYIFCDDEYLLQINQQFLKHDFYTDIITFELSAQGEALLSDIYISIERIRENAKFAGVPFNEELHRVIFHGTLHLCGYKDKSKADRENMRVKESEWLSRYFVSRETLAR